jgi:hypothetical protein
VDNLSYTGGSVLAFNPVNNSLFIVGQHQSIAEISIPQSIVNSSNLSDLPTSTVLQPWTNVLSNLPNPLSGATDGAPIGGLMVYNGQLIGTDYAYYSGASTQYTSHFVLSSLNLSTASVGGLYAVGNQNGRLVAGYMTPIPSEWQATFGAPALTGQADLCIISTTSSGPAAFGFDPSTLGTGVAPVTPYLYYPATSPLGPFEGPADPLQSGTTSVDGAVFAPGSSSVLFFGSTGTNYNGYGVGMDWGANNWNKGPQSLNGQRVLQVWAYNANDLLAVKQGTMAPWQVQPYDVWNFTLPNTTGTSIGTVTCDPTTGRIYVPVLGADNTVPYSYLPLIEVFQVTLPSPGSSASAAPQIGTLAATPSLPPDPNAGFDTPAYVGTEAGPIAAGTTVILTAGNVYAINPGGSVTQVAFFLDTNNDGVLELGSDQLLGNGTASSISNASHNWTLTISTTGMSSGTYTVFTQALDADGLVSDPVATTFTII